MFAKNVILDIFLYNASKEYTFLENVLRIPRLEKYLI